jgi:HK97 family phage prohead protease
MNRIIKTYPVEARKGQLYPTIDVRAVDEGKVTALVSVWDVVDFQQDRVRRGAFKNSLERWRASGDPIPVLVDHDWSLAGHVGYVDPNNVEEVEEGLLARDIMFDLDHPAGARVFQLIKSRRIREWSFAYDTIREKRLPDGSNELLELDLLEITSTIRGANPHTMTLSAKALLSATDTEAKKHEAKRLINVVAYRVKNTVPGLLEDVGKAALAVVDDENAGVSDVHDAVSAVVSRYVTLQKYAAEDAAVARKWGSYSATRAVEELVAETSAKGQGRHESVSFTETNAILVREHLLQRHPAVNAVQLDSTGIDDLNRLHRLAHGGGVPDRGKSGINQATFALIDAVDELERDLRGEKSRSASPDAKVRGPYSVKSIQDEVRATKQREDADRERFESENLALMKTGKIDWAAADDYDRRRAAAEKQELERKWQERLLEADRRLASEQIAREEAMKHGTPFSTWTNNGPPQIVEERHIERVEPRITVIPREDEGETVRVPLRDDVPLRLNPTPEPEPLASADDEPSETFRAPIGGIVEQIPTVANGEGTVYRMPTSNVDDVDATLREDELK